MKAIPILIASLLLLSPRAIRAEQTEVSPHPIPSSGLAAKSTPAVGQARQSVSHDRVPEGLAKSDWTSIRAAYEAGQHAFQPIDGGWQARNPGQQWLTKFDGRGFVAQPNDGAWQWGLELKSYGFPGNERSISDIPTVKAAGQRLTYQWAAGMQEWFVNDSSGLEHGFTLTERPTEIKKSKFIIQNFLSLTLAVRGDLRPVLTADAQGVHFQDAAGATVLNYTGLKVWDADGKILSSRFETAETSVRLLVDERGARYPLTIDPIAQQAYLKASNTGASDNFGIAVAVSGDTVIVGAFHEDSSTTGVNSTPNEGATDSGAAYVFARSGSTWTQQAYLKASNTGAGDYFGYTLAVSGDTVIVGAYAESSSSMGINSIPNDLASNAGAAYVFVRNGTTWTQQAYLKANNTGANDQFGNAVAIMEDTIVVGANWESSSTTGINSIPNELAAKAGATYVFVRSGTTWMQQAYVKASNTGVGDNFGVAVAVSGDTMVVGSMFENSNTSGVNSIPDDLSFRAGAAYVFTRSGTTWTQQAYLKPSNTGADDWFGASVAISGNTVVIGAHGEDSSTTGVNSMPNDSAADSGAAYVFVRSGTTWNQQAYIKASNTGAGDYFGYNYTLAISGDTVVVGAYREDSNAIGIGGDQADNSVTDSGAAYVFTRSGTTWTQQNYLKVSNSEAGDQFGRAVAFSGDTVIIGSYGEDSSTTGANSTPNNSSANSGAAYVFTGLGLNTVPTISTPTTVNVTTTTATLGGNVTNDGGTTVTARGVVFAETAINNHPQLGGTGVTNVTGSGTTGVFTVNVGSLMQGTAYSFAAYATNSAGTSYSGTDSFTTLTMPTITSESTLPAGTVDVAYTLQFTATGGTNPYVWSVASGSLPDGLNLSDAGLITGTPSTAGSSTFTVRATDQRNEFASKEFSLTVLQPLDITTTSPLPDGMAGQSYSRNLAAIGGVPPYSWTIQSGSLPSDLNLDTNGSITGTPEVWGTFNFNVRVTDAADGLANVALSLTIHQPPSISSGSPLPAGMVGNSYNQTLAAANGTPPYTWTLQSGTLPGSLELVGDGSITGTPTTAGTATFMARVTDIRGGFASQEFSLTILPASADLASLQLSVTTAPVFSPSITHYTATTYDATLAVTPTIGNTGAAIDHRINGGTWQSVASGTEISGLALNPGINHLEIRVTAADGITIKTYALEITRFVPVIAVSEGSTPLVDGSPQPLEFGPASSRRPATRVLTITNSGTGQLTLGAITASGANVSDFAVGTLGTSTLSAGGSTTLSIVFTPTAAGTRNASVQLVNNTGGDLNPFDLLMRGTGLTLTNDTDNDGMNDAAEFNMAALGFNWQVAQEDLVSTYFNNATDAGLYTKTQVHALHVGSPILEKDSGTNLFRLTLGLKKSTDLMHYTPLPMSAPFTSFNANGEVEFHFESPDSAAFFMIEAK